MSLLMLDAEAAKTAFGFDIDKLLKDTGDKPAAIIVRMEPDYQPEQEHIEEILEAGFMPGRDCMVFPKELQETMSDTLAAMMPMMAWVYGAWAGMTGDISEEESRALLKGLENAMEDWGEGGDVLAQVNQMPDLMGGEEEPSDDAGLDNLPF